VSRSAPTGLPLFNEIRDALLRDLKVESYEGLVPEPFFLALRRAGADVDTWLRSVLNGTPNTAHRALAALARDGARVWTVNFDELIEAAADGTVDVCAWPAAPRPAALYKPHGTLSGELIVGADQVLEGLRDDWARALVRDVEDRVAVFVGYSARDLDFRPLWHDVLKRARSVIWFTMPEQAAWSELEQALGMTVDFRPRHTRPDETANPSRDFVEWCDAHGLFSAAAGQAAQLDQRPEPRPVPRLRGARPIARGAIRELVGDIDGARRQYLRTLLVPWLTAHSARRLTNLVMGHGGRLVAAVLGSAAVLPKLNRLGAVRRRAARKRGSILLNIGEHEQVLAMTERAEQSNVSTELILRAGAVRYLGSLDDAARLAEEALRRALAERHNVRAANAAFQVAIARLWAGRADDAADALANLAPLASLAASRWVAWSEWAAASLAIYRANDPAETLRLLSQAQTRFLAEGLHDGVISVLTVRLTALRQLRDATGYLDTREALDRELARRGRGIVYYSRGHQFTAEAIAFEDGEFARAGGQLDEARGRFEIVAKSRYRIHQALGQLGLAATADDPALRQGYANQATAIAATIGAHGIMTCAARVLSSTDAIPPLLFP
jgi:hypothetical protein